MHSLLCQSTCVHKSITSKSDTEEKKCWIKLSFKKLQKTHANRKSSSKSRKHLHQFESRCCKCSQHNQIKNCICSAFPYLVVLWVFAVHFFIWLCCEHLQHLLSNWWRCFLDLLELFLFAARWALSATVHSFIKLSLDHWCHMDYFIEALTMFLGLECGSCVVVLRVWNNTRVSN